MLFWIVGLLVIWTLMFGVFYGITWWSGVWRRK
jgi:hypothetical protein